ncbi:peptide/nickel transport system permease protein [Kribbella amoyensis]|uniref:Peptide/nickel transport system permease protein n=1 Tax=Kribbella amoyensis TaxID=996641 RepID=A0A561C0J8_9ACTN|nr:ABC transporter permease [Kribbella amoyensis]TWD84624.1 peptide/nickel transport system permease protein [Kribbella amoyensis]
MYAHLIRRLLQFAVVLVLGSIAVWAFTFALPGDPASVLLGPDASPAELEATRQRLGLDGTVVEQYLSWIGHALAGDLGSSYYSGQPVVAELLDRIPATVQLAGFAMVLTLVIAVPVGIVVALRPRSVAGRLFQGYLTAGLAVPTFWLGLLLIIVLAVQLRWLPASSDYVPFWGDPGGALTATILPALAIAVHTSSVTARFLATSLGDVMGKDYIRTARAKGVPERDVIRRHALRNASLPTITIVGLQLGGFLGGTVVIEAVFNYPGLGRLLYTAIGERDYALVQGGVLFVVATFLLLNLLVDLGYAVLDPRIRLT